MENDSSDTFVSVLSPPPPNRNDLESHALDKEGRERYLKSLEARLNRLQGKDRRLTSKDIMSALSEARDDHLADARTTTTAYVNEFAEMDILEPEEKTAGCCGVWRHGHLRQRGWGRQELSDADRREYACLVDCDELEWSVRNETVSTDGGCHGDDDTVRPVRAT